MSSPFPDRAGTTVLMALGLVATSACSREARHFDDLRTRGPQEKSAWAVNEGKRLYEAFCSGCHSSRLTHCAAWALKLSVAQCRLAPA